MIFASRSAALRLFPRNGIPRFALCARALSFALGILIVFCFCGRPAPTGREAESPAAALIFAPHPDDETLAFGGLVYTLAQSGRRAVVVVVTDGEAYFDACDFWKDGCPPGSTDCPGGPVSECSPEDLAAFAQARRGESRQAMALLGLRPEDLSFLGYPDRGLRTMLEFPDSLVGGSTSVLLSETGKSFRGRNLLEDLTEILRRYPGADLYTTHPRDHHSDHSALGLFVDEARSLVASGGKGWGAPVRLFWAVVHEPGVGRDLGWPPPSCTWDPDWTRREERYDPTAALTPPASMSDSAWVYPLPEELWDPAVRNPPLLRRAIEMYATQIGSTLQGGGSPAERYRGCMDATGYLLGFVKRNHLFWEAEAK